MAAATVGPFFSIDVECVATGTDHNARAVAQISLVNQMEQPLLNIYVRPEEPVVSYLTPLTGLSAELLSQHGVPLPQALATLRAALPRDAVLVGQNIGADVKWLGLREGEDFRGLLDLQGLFRVFNTQYNSWSVFNQEHLARVLLGVDAAQEAHNAVTDAIKSMRLFNMHTHLRADPAQLSAAQSALLAAPQLPSFARRNPSFEGCCMGNRKTCTCGGTFFFG